MRFGRPSRFTAQAPVEGRQRVLRGFRKQEVNGGKEDVRDWRPPRVPGYAEQIRVERDLFGERCIQRSRVCLRLFSELGEALREPREIALRVRLRQIARGRAPALFALLPHDCAEERSW